VLESVRDLSEDVRRIVNGPLHSVATRVDGLVQREAGTVGDIIERADRSMKRIEDITADLRAITKGADPRIEHILRNLDDASAEAKDLVATAKSELTQTGDAIRGKLDKLDGVITNTESITRKIDEDKGTLGKLVNDPEIADNVEEITDQAKGFLGTVFGLKTYVGMRSEYNVGAGLLRHYISVELHTRPDKFYLVELEKGPRGAYPDVTLTFDPTVDPNHWIRKTVIEDKIRFTFQFAKRFSWLTLRYGLKESTGGVGADTDLHWFDRDLRLSADVFDASFDQYPRVKLTAAYEVFRHIYVLGGVDELLNTPTELSIIKGASEVPIQFDTFRYGRDYFFGGMLRFNDEDLSALLAVGGSAVAGAAR
jgi:phospholipid/cholesterol/gamma-HCH transport system substrate-binding protein